MFNKSYNYKTGTSLVEVIIVLAIVSLTILASMGLIARTRVEIKNNELEDKSNSILLKVIENFKNPSNSILPSNLNLSTAGPFFFTYKPDVNGVFSLTYLTPGSYFAALPVEVTSGLKFSDVCSDRSPFYLIDQSNFAYCQQVVITPIRGQDITTEIYKIDTTLIYESSRGIGISNLTTYKYGGFN